MPTHAETRTLPHTPEQMFDLVADVERYPEFLPWCRDARIWKREGNVIHADLVIGYKLFQERFTSRVTLERPGHIRVEYLKGPLKYLNNHWRFMAADLDACVVDFFVDFEFRNPIFQKVMGVFFNEIVRRMVAAFEARANQLYG
ncbi:MAG: type II toxin-antitoxin system RatA family toxin [Rhodospirillales bacterium]|nr:type II toxin-antitoxin system RatA family toxin [Alphaproteobacteria bacterium]MCB9987540.1 type II toxin-antitoxin system RatA family toxin [Rhodospirillales bacterium]USO07738.1 MAG: type II toxin-antitoxin system RatA family toxin [Rhodospirillales bacterium]